jgi:hypothetical protein
MSIRMPLVNWGGFMLRVSLEQGYERFLDLPVPVVLVVLWVVGAVLEGAFVAALYRSGLVLVQLLGGTL